MSNDGLPISAIISELEVCCNSLRDEEIAIANTRDAIIAFGEMLQVTINQLPKQKVRFIGLRVKIEVCGPRLPESDDVEIGALPAIDEEGFDRRPGATALYLEALGDGKNRQYCEIRSSPGTCVLVNTSIDGLKEYVQDLDGVGVDDTGSPRLYCVDRPDKEKRSVRYDSLLIMFLTQLADLLIISADFNTALRQESAKSG